MRLRLYVRDGHGRTIDVMDAYPSMFYSFIPATGHSYIATWMANYPHCAIIAHVIDEKGLHYDL